MTVVDWVIVGVIAASMLVSLRRGFVKEALSLLTWIVAIVVARMFSSQVATLLEDTIDVPSLRLGAAYALLVIGTLVVGALVNNLLSEVVRMTGLGSLDGLLGSLFGLARGLLVILLVVAGLYYLTPVKEDAWWQQSTLIPHLIEAVEMVAPVLKDQGSKLVEAYSAWQPNWDRLPTGTRS